MQGFECKVLEPYLSNPTEDVLIPYIFMEWMHVRVNLDDNCPNLETLVQMFMDLDYIPWDVAKSKQLDAKSIKTEKVSTNKNTFIFVQISNHGMQ